MTIQTRDTVYPVRSHAKRESRPHPENPRKRKKVWVGDVGGTGKEIVREISVCPACRDQLK